MLGNLARQTAIYTVANLLARGAAVVALVVLPFFLSVAQYGALGLFLALAAILNVVLPLEVTQGLARHYGEADGVSKRLYAASAFWFTAAMVGLGAILGLVFARPLCIYLLGDAAELDAFRFAIPFFAFNSLFYFAQSQFRWEFRTVDYALVSLCFATLTLALSVAFAALMPAPLSGVMAGQALGAAASVALGAWRLRATIDAPPSRPHLARMLRFSLPLVPASVALMASLYGSRLILTRMMGMAEVGAYTFAGQFAAVAGFVLLGAQSSMTPLVMSHHHEEATAPTVARFFEIFSTLGLWVCLVFGLFAPEAVALLHRPGYGPAGLLVIFLAPASLFLQLYIFFPGFAVAKRTERQMAVSIASGLVAILCNWAFIAAFGLIGAAIGTLAGACLFLAAWVALSQPLYPIPVRWRRVLLAWAAGAAAAAVGLTLPFPGLLAVAVKAALLAGVVLLTWKAGLVPVAGMARMLARGLRAAPVPGPADDRQP
ncbi:MAG: lipopolysaccharide biosynthesis protein [Allosphingosinicella sp.]